MTSGTAAFAATSGCQPATEVPAARVAGAMGPVAQGLDGLRAALDALIGVLEAGGLESLDDADLVTFLQEFERLRNRVPLVDHSALLECEARRLPERLTQPSLARVLVSLLRVSSGEAQRRVRAAESVGRRRSMVGEPLEPRRPVLAAAQRAGEVSAEQVQLLVRALEAVDRPGFDPADVAAGERLLTEQAAVFEPKVLGQLADRVVAAIDPDGSVPDDRLNVERRHFLLRPTRDGAYVGEFRLTGVAGSKLAAVLRPLARPRVHPLPDPGSASAPAAAEGAARAESSAPTLGAELAGLDQRSHGQRMHDALEEMCDRLLRSGGLPASGGTPATVIVTVTAEDLVDQVGYGVTSDGTLLPAERVLELAAAAEVIPTVLNRSGAVLAAGRTRRIASAAQTWALIARDGGCSFPGCDRPPELCERHHVVPWVEGGKTDLDNLTLVCRYHHAQFAGRGWTATIDADGLPAWTPPWWIDRERRPLVNPRVHVQRLARRHVRERAAQPALVTAGGADP